MSLGEFDLIERFFKRPVKRSVLGVGDDCALLQSRPATQMAISCDMLVEGRHFFSDVNPAHLGHKALAVNLSDLAACGAKPLAFTLAVALPRADPQWLSPFSQGLLALANAHECELIGGDTTQGPLNICITVFGEIDLIDGKSQALLRSGAQVGDDIYVSGTLGDARLALELLRGTLPASVAMLAQSRPRLEQPTPRVALGLALRGLASAAIDVSDGLLGDLGHILDASAVGATINSALAQGLMATQLDAAIDPAQRLGFVLAGGDEYELVFTAAPSRRSEVASAAQSSQTPVSRIGQIEQRPGLRLVDAQGKPKSAHFPSFDHFKSGAPADAS